MKVTGKGTTLLLKNRYQLEEILGRGGAGVVYRAFDVVQEHPVAVKFLKTSQNGPDQAAERLHREAALLSRLTHPNIVGFLDSGEEADTPYLVLEYVARLHPAGASRCSGRSLTNKKF